MEQNPEDEPAVELLKRIEAEKAILIRIGKIRKEKPLLALKDSEVSFPVPSGWKWTRLGETVNNHSGGGTPSKNNLDYWDGDIFWASVKDIGKSKYVDQTIDRITQAGLENSSSNLIPPGNLIVVTRMGLGKISINRVPIAINQDLRALSLSSLTDINFYYIFFKTASYEGTGLTVKGIKVEELLNFPFPLPPLAEQHRIIAKVDELMALCDELETAQVKRESRCDRLVTATLHGLNNGDIGQEPNTKFTFKESARFYFDHLPRLTTRPEHIHQLRQTILNLAIRGKLVPQDPKDEYASELLERIQVTMSRLVKEDKIRKQKPLPLIGPDEIKFELPERWKWVRLGQVASLIGGYAYDSNSYVEKSPNQVIRLGNVKNDALLLNQKPVFIPDSVANDTRDFLILPGDILITMTGTKAKRDYAFTVVMTDSELTKSRLFLNQRVGAIRPFLSDLIPLINIFLKADTLLDILFATATGTANQGNIGSGAVLNLPIPLPPLTEQHQIVAKVNELMALCDELENQLTTTSTTRRQLLEATLRDALSA